MKEETTRAEGEGRESVQKGVKAERRRWYDGRGLREEEGTEEYQKRRLKKRSHVRRK